jgi:hypothetical protein
MLYSQLLIFIGCKKKKKCAVHPENGYSSPSAPIFFDKRENGRDHREKEMNHLDVGAPIRRSRLEIFIDDQ